MQATQASPDDEHMRMSATVAALEWYNYFCYNGFYETTLVCYYIT